MKHGSLTNAPTLTQRGRRRARKAGLVYINNFSKGYRRRRCGRGFTYLSTRGQIIKSARIKKRIKSLAIPPAWEKVWICTKPNGHIQAAGRDAYGRRQYIYHPQWLTISSATKYDRMQLMAKMLPRIRRRVLKDLNRKRLSKNRVMATVIRLIDKTGIRVGNNKYTEKHGTHGATTLTNEHVELNGFKISLDFPGKSGQQRELELNDEKVARVIQQCEEIDGQFLFCYQSGHQTSETINSTDVNDYLKEITGQSITAKDFRTWRGSVTALSLLAGKVHPQQTKTERKRLVNVAIAETATVLGNTKAVCRNSYIHPAILAAGESGELESMIDNTESSRQTHNKSGLTVDETLFARLIPFLNS